MKPFNQEKGCEIKEMKPGEFALHGDVIIERIESLPKGFKKFDALKDNTLALGEATGHRHQLFGEGVDLREEPKTKTKYLRLVTPTALKHQEHRQIVLPPGDYRIGIQREYDPFEKLVRKVAD